MSESTAATAAAPAKARKELVGIVSSSKMNKTIVVLVERRVPHAQFKKIVRRTSKFYAHDEQQVAKEGDSVRIRETRPLSKLKRWELVEVIAQ